MDNQFNQQPYSPAPVQEEKGPVTSMKAMIFAIIGLALAGSVSIAGLIFSIIAKKQIATFEDYNGFTDFGKIKAAKIISKIGFILSIVCMVIYAIYFIAIIGLAASGSSSYYAILPVIF